MQINIYKKEWNLNEDYINSYRISKQQICLYIKMYKYFNI